MPYFKQDGAMHGWNGLNGYVPPAPVTRIICDLCAELEVPFELMGTNPDGTKFWVHCRPWKWAPWKMGQPCDGCGRSDKDFAVLIRAHRHAYP